MKKLVKYVISLTFCTLVRLVKIFPNNDPIMGFALPFARKDKWWQAFLFPFIAMVSFDIITAKVGPWTLVTSSVYGLLALLFYRYFRTQSKVGLGTYLKGSIFGVLIFDFLTGPIMSSYMFRMPFEVALIGQIPFTLMHLASSITYTAIFVPILDPEIRTSLHDAVFRWADSLKSMLAARNGIKV